MPDFSVYYMKINVSQGQKKIKYTWDVAVFQQCEMSLPGSAHIFSRDVINLWTDALDGVFRHCSHVRPTLLPQMLKTILKKKITMRSRQQIDMSVSHRFWSWILRSNHVVLFARGVISSQPVHRVLNVPFHHLSAVRRRVSVNQPLNSTTSPCQKYSSENVCWLLNIYLESIIFLAASAYLNKSFLASSLYLMRDSLNSIERRVTDHFHILILL